MPVLIFIDGRRETVGYSQAAAIKQVKSGATVISGNPVTDRQLAFAATVESIIFDQLPIASNPISRKAERDTELSKIKNNPELKGKAKFDAIGLYLKGRHIEKY